MWHKRHLKHMSDSAFALAMVGKMLIFVGLGSLLSAMLIDLSYYVLLIAAGCSLAALNATMIAYKHQKKLGYRSFLMMSVAVFVIAFLFGMHSAPLPIAYPLLIIGALMAIPALKEYLAKGKKSI